MAHLTHCPSCAKKYAKWLEGESSSGGESARQQLGLPAPGHDAGCVPPASEASHHAASSFRQLAELPVEQSGKWIERSPDRRCGLTLAERLIQESDRNLPAHPRDSARYADLAYQVAIRSGHQDFAAAVRATARKANAHRIAGERDSAGHLLAFARQLAASEDVISTLVAAELDRFEGTLRLDEHRFAQAEPLFRRARKLYEQLGDTRRVAHMDLNLSDLYYRRGEISRAVQAGRALQESLSPEIDPVLFLCAENNLALFLCDAGEHEEALLILEGDDGFCVRHGDKYTKCRRLWVAGRASAALGDNAGAEEMLRVVRDVLLSEETGYDAALVSLDLALLYAQTGRRRELRETAEALAPIFRSYRLHDEAAAALRLFLEAVREETATAAFVEEVDVYLRAAKYDPTRTFRRRRDVN
jgi:tetratricopeptide (TPR) repeat protein